MSETVQMNAETLMSKPTVKERRAKPRTAAENAQTGLPLVLQVIEPRRAAALDRLHRGDGRLSFDLDGEELEVALQWPAPAADAQSLSLTIGSALGDLRLAVPLSLCLKRLEQFAPGTDFERIETSVMALLMEAAFEAEIAELEQALDTKFEVRSLERRPPVSAADFALRLKGAETIYNCAFHEIGVPLLERFSECLAGSATPTPSAVDLPLETRICLDAVPLRLTDLKALATGDVVMMGSGYRNFLMVGDRLVTGFVPEGNGLRLISEPVSTAKSQWDWIMKDGGMSVGTVEDGTLDDIPVNLVFELGRKSLTVSEIRKLAAGSIVAVPERNRETVSLVANGKSIGEGEIVRIGDGLGVRILSIASNA